MDVSSLNNDYTFEQEQGDDLIEVTATIDPFGDLQDFNVTLIDLDGNRRRCDIEDYRTLFTMAVTRSRVLYQNCKEEARYV